MEIFSSTRLKIMNHNWLILSLKIQSPRQNRDKSELITSHDLLFEGIKIIACHILNTCQILDIK
jgi:hypothetical protein